MSSAPTKHYLEVPPKQTLVLLTTRLWPGVRPPSYAQSMTATADLLDRSESVRVRTLAQLEPSSQSKLGQFFTNSRTASLLTSMPRLPREGSVRLLDPGAGSGALSAALIARLLAEAPGVSIDLTAVELDPSVVPALRETLTACAATAESLGASLTFEVVQGSYVDVAETLGSDFDIVVMNPPYAKLAAGDPDRRKVAVALVDPANIYAAFIALGISNLKTAGQLVAITPRSFTNGLYFEPFRRWLLAEASFDRIHIYGSRSSVFADTGVLQENIIWSVTRGGSRGTVSLTASTDHHEIGTARTVRYDEIVHPDDAHQYIRIPAATSDTEIVGLMAQLPSRLADLGVQASTGRVVDFRSRDQLVEPALAEHYPMVYPSNISGGAVTHPRTAGKPQWYSITEADDRKWLVPSGIYVLIKRFSAKEERRRIVAGVWDDALQRATPVAFDNKLNYIHAAGQGLDRELAFGLALWLNSTVVDDYFRTFSGHTQVNATDLRGMRFPAVEVLRELGEGRSEMPDQTVIDELVQTVLSTLEAAA